MSHRCRPAAWCALALAVAVAGCDANATPTAQTADDRAPHDGAADDGAAYRSHEFSVPFDLKVPEWLPAEPSEEEANFVTWESTSEDRKVRMLVPLSVYRPGDTGPTPPPEDYLDYLRAQSAVGGSFTDEVTLTVSGREATIVTATSDRPLDGGLGCHEEGLAAADCWGLQPDLELRIAVIPLDDVTLIAWSRAVRDDPSADDQFADFDEMMASLNLR